jgi:hypothetical protein
MQPRWWWGVLCLACAGCLDRTLAELNPCLTSGENESVGATGIDRVDLLFVVDNSLSMLQEQAKLRAQFPKLIRTLTTGQREDGSRFSPVTDMHLAVITTDMGTPGEPDVPSCTETGDDGVFQHQGNPSGDPSLAGCATTYPTFLEYRAQSQDPEQLARDFACIASVGSGGCGYEQQLEAPLKALWPRSYKDASGVLSPAGFSFLGTRGQPTSAGHGDIGNLGFLRNEADRPSLLAIVLVTDEDDCSASTSIQFTEDPAYAEQHVNLRCFENPQNLWPVTRYVEQLPKLRPGRPDLVLFAALAGVPTRLIDAADGVDLSDDAARNAYYDGILADADMQEVPTDTARDPDTEPDSLRPACESVSGGAAVPARRITEVVKGLGAQATLQSICAESFEPAMDAIIALITDRLKGVCLSRPLVRNHEGAVACEVVWELPAASEGFTEAPRSCAERPYLAPVDQDTIEPSKPGRTLCQVRQLPVRERNVVANAAAPEGWYYDDFSPDVLATCKDHATPQRVSFTDGAQPPRGVTVSLQCVHEAQRHVSSRSDVDPTRPHPELGDGCEPKDATTVPDALCSVTLLDGRIDQSMFCHPQRNVCVRSCQSDDDCPAGWLCDDRPATLDATRSTTRPSGAAICVNPVCG